MQVTITYVGDPTQSFSTFADEHWLAMDVTERSGGSPNSSMRFYACFKHSETKRSTADGCLAGTYGNGATPDAAIKNYAEKLRGKLLVVNAMSDTERREIQCPNEWSHE